MAVLGVKSNMLMEPLKKLLFIVFIFSLKVSYQLNNITKKNFADISAMP